jgi:PAS domain S-box-containing protein
MENNIMENTRYKVLFIEDNQLDQMAFKRFVCENDIPYDCIIASSVSEALQAMDSNQFDIVITDHELGDGTAFEILKSVKNIPVIIVTGAGDEDTAIKAWKDGAYDYLIKDLDQNYLKAITITVENAIKHKIVEKKLQLLSGAVMSTDDSVYIADMQGKIIFVNKAFCVTYGYKEDEIIGENSTVLWVGKQQTENTRSVFQTRTVGSSWEVGFYHKRKDDSVFPISLSRSTIKDSNGNEVAIVGVSRDITERILIEDELRTENQNLKKQIRELEERLGKEHSCTAINS